MKLLDSAMRMIKFEKNKDKRLYLFLFSVLGLIVFLINYRYVKYASMGGGNINDDFLILSNIIYRSGVIPEFIDSFGMKGAFFQTHFSPIVSIASLLSYIQPLPKILYFAVFQSIAPVILSLAIFQFTCKYYRHLFSIKFLFLLSLMASLNGIYQMVIYFYHFEHLMPTFIFLFLSLSIQGYKKSAICIFILLLLVREDAGFHLVAITGLYCFYKFLKNDISGVEKHLIIITVISFLYSVFAIYIKNVWGGDDSFSRIYFDGSFDHLKNGELERRLLAITKNRLYYTLPALIIVAYAVILRAPQIAIGVLAYIPWSIVGLIAKASEANDAYYTFPLSAMFFWLLVLPKIDKKFAQKHNIKTIVIIQFITIFLSFVFTAHKFKKIILPDANISISNIRIFQNELNKNKQNIGLLKFTKPIVALLPQDLSAKYLMAIPRPNKTGIGRHYTGFDKVTDHKDSSLVYYLGDPDVLAYLSIQSNLSMLYKIKDTNIRIATYPDSSIQGKFSNLELVQNKWLEHMHVHKVTKYQKFHSLLLRKIRKKERKKGFFILSNGKYRLNTTIAHNGPITISIYDLLSKTAILQQSYDAGAIECTFNVYEKSPISIKIYPEAGVAKMLDFKLQKITNQKSTLNNFKN